MYSVFQKSPRSSHPYERAKVVIYYSIALGLSPVYISRKGKTPELVVDTKLYLISCMYLLFYITLLISMIGSSVVKEVLEMSNKAFMALIVINNGIRFVTTVVLVIDCFLHRNQIKTIFENVAEIDIALRKLGIERNFKLETLFLSMWMLCKPLFYITIVTIQYWNTFTENTSGTTIPSLLIGIYSNLLPSVANNQYSLFALAIRRNFFDINRCLRKPINEIAMGNQVILTPGELKCLMRFHSTLCETISMANKAFGASLITLTAWQLGFMQIELFYAYAATAANKPVETICPIALTVIVFLEVLFRLIGCQMTCNEMHKTKKIVHKLILAKRSGNLIKELVIFSRQLLHVKVRFTAAGMCPMDLTILYWTFAFSTSMLIVLYQFSLSSHGIGMC